MTDFFLTEILCSRRNPPFPSSNSFLCLWGSGKIRGVSFLFCPTRIETPELIPSDPLRQRPFGVRHYLLLKVVCARDPVLRSCSGNLDRRDHWSTTVTPSLDTGQDKVFTYLDPYSKPFKGRVYLVFPNTNFTGTTVSSLISPVGHEYRSILRQSNLSRRRVVYRMVYHNGRPVHCMKYPSREWVGWECPVI